MMSDDERGVVANDESLDYLYSSSYTSKQASWWSLQVSRRLIC
jgi:hypothetical protein